MKNIKYIIYKEGEYFVSQCLNVDVSSFGNTKEEATDNLKEALELYFEDEESISEFIPVSEAHVGEIQINLK